MSHGVVGSRLLPRAGELLFDSPMARRTLRPHRARLLDHALSRGLSPVLSEPLRWLVTGELAPGDRARVERVEAIRSTLAARHGESAPSPEGRQVPLPRLALVASVDRRFGTLLYLCAKATGARTVLELGSCVGIGTTYLASAGSARVVSVESSPARAAIARETAANVSDRAEIVVGRFDDVLSGILDGLAGGIDAAWIDGHHRRDATLSYFDAIKRRLNEGAVVAVDDVRWSSEMREAWGILQRADGFADTVDLGPIGIGVWRGEGTVPRVHDLRGINGRPQWLHAAEDRLRRRPGHR